MSKILNIFFVGDIVGQPGLDIAINLIPNYLKKYSVDFLIINGENTTEGKGIAEDHAKKALTEKTATAASGRYKNPMVNMAIAVTSGCERFICTQYPCCGADKAED